LLEAHLLEDRFGDVVVRPPVGGALGIGELVDEVPAVLTGQAFGLGVDLRRILHQMALATVERDLRDLFLEVVAGITAMNGKPSMRAKYASEIAVEPLDASITGAPGLSQPLHNA
jgi:hypothetical protein